MSDKTTENLLEAVIEKKPVDFREIFEELMVPKLKAVVGEHSQVVAESLFLNDDDEELEEEDEQLAEAGYDKDAVDKQIKKDRVGKGESKKIHALLKGRQRGDGDTADWKEKEEQKRFERNRRHG